MYRKTYVEINIDNLKNNVKNIVNYYKEYKYYFGVVKASCYGHGTKYVIKELIDSGINYLAVSNLEEALEIREFNKEIPILCLEPINIEYLNICINNNITITLHDYEYSKKVLKYKLNKNLKIHLKIDSGMNRIGFKNKCEINEIYNKLKVKENVEIEGIFSHFATLGIYGNEWEQQVKNFKKLTEDINFKEIPIVHFAKSTAFINHPKIEFTNAIRLGIAMYGYDTSVQRNNRFKLLKRNNKKTITNIPIELKPALKMHTEIIQIKPVFKNEFIGYGADYRVRKNEKIAILAVGYDDGIFRKSKNRDVEINNKRYKIIGDVAMGMCSVKIDENVKINDKVTLIGDLVTIQEVANHNETSIYEIMCNIGKNIPRVYIKNNKIIAIEETQKILNLIK